MDCGSQGSRLLWVGGDGSTRVYEPPVNGAWSTWVARNPDGPPDTLVLADSGYVRRLRGGGAVYFNGAGLHYKTVNRLGQTTRFVYGPEWLTGIYVPGSGPGGPGTGDPAWILHWDYGAHVVRGISATLQGAPTRTTLLAIDGSRRLTAITDPDSGSVGFAYGDPSSSRRITRQQDRRGALTHYAYGGAGKLAAARLQMGTTLDNAVDPVTQFIPAETQGVAWDTATATAASAAAALAWTRIDGPRHDVDDITWLWLSRAGAVQRVRDALGAETYVRHDPRFPALPTQVTSPAGFVRRVHYDGRGRVDTARVVSVLGDGRDHVTLYQYDDRWDAPTAVTSYQVAPNGAWTQLAGTARAAYDPLNGNVLWRQQGDDPARRVEFRYHASGAAAGLPSSVRAPSGVPGQAARDSLIYDARGNLQTTVSPLGFLTHRVRDALGRDSLVYTPVDSARATTVANLTQHGARQAITWDAMDRPVRTVSTGPAVTHEARANLLPAPSPQEQLTVVTEYDGEGLPRRVERSVSPDPGMIGSLVTAFTYDRAGRTLTETEGVGQTQSYAYDLAGTQTWTTPRGHAIVTRHDALGRVVRRETPEVIDPKGCAPPECHHAFPAYPNAAGGALRIPAEWTTFRFDGGGNLVHAENGDAIVRRGYTAGGLLVTDSLFIRDYDGPGFAAHAYGVGYGYHVDGRLSSMQHPVNLAGSAAWDSYGYDAVTGALTDLSDRTGLYFHFRYNAAGQMTWMGGPGYADSTRYDLEGRRLWRHEWTGAETLHLESFRHDARGKVLTAGTVGVNDYHQWYSGLGMLVATDWDNHLDAEYSGEEFVTDALGNVAWRRSGPAGSVRGASPSYETRFAPGTGRVLRIDRRPPQVPGLGDFPEVTERAYDASGNLSFATQQTWGEIAGTGAQGHVRDVRSRSYYAADERLRYFQENDVYADGTRNETRGVWEEYRYDPLGRRVLVRSNRADLCTALPTQCVSHVTRYVWAGDQVLWELRANPAEASGLEAVSSGGDLYGRVSYTHAGGIDRPLVIYKDGSRVLPHENWRGQFAKGTYPSGARSDCVNGATTGCERIPWPGHRTTAWHVGAQDPQIHTWWGGLVDGMRDASGQLYMRNRYYDPSTGQFTQPDPIGLAGGLNSYGFAAGDPVSYSDPYGLCAAHLVQVPADPDEPERVCPGNLTHGEYYQREDGASVARSALPPASAPAIRSPHVTIIDDSAYPLAVVIPGLVGCPSIYEGYARFPLPGRPHNPFFDLRRRGDVENKRSGSYGYYRGEMWDTGRWAEPVHGTAWCRVGLIILHYSHGNVH